MRSRVILLMIAVALAGCSDNNLAAPASSTPKPGSASSRTSSVAFCAKKKIYPIAENTWILASTSVNGHSLPPAAFDFGTYDYSLDITPQIASDLQRSAVAGC